MQSDCSNCVKLQQQIDRLQKKVMAGYQRRYRERKAHGMGDHVWVCREIKRTAPGRPHWCPTVQSKQMKAALRADPCRPVPEVGAGAIILTRCEYIRLESKIQRGDSCWLWQGGFNKAGYGIFGWENDKWAAHRFMYTLYVRAIDYGNVIDHLCTVKACVNPEHLEQVTQGVNIRRRWDINLTETTVG